MGDRANIVIRDTDRDKVGYVYLYTHWGGSHLPEALHRALTSSVAQRRLHDLPYLTRIIFCRMLMESGETLDGETGVGISAFLTDNDDYPLLVVDISSQLIWTAPEEDPEQRDLPAHTFDQFIALGLPTWEDFSPDRIHPNAPTGSPTNDARGE